jgi:hypothetical protein
MTRRPPPRLAVALLERFVPDSEPLAGDLVEEHARRQSAGWFWWQVVGALAVAATHARVEIRPLRLVREQPLDALERTIRWQRRVRPVNLTASPVPGAGGLGLLVLLGLLTIVDPRLWSIVISGWCAGVLMGVALITRQRGLSRPITTISLH